MKSQINSLHSCWCQTTGQELNLRATERIWYELAKLDFTDADLLCVLKHVLSYNKTHSNCQMKVQVHKICGDIEQFASICAEAKAKERNKIPKPTPRQEILTSFRRTEPEPKGSCVPASEVIAKLRQCL